MLIYNTSISLSTYQSLRNLTTPPNNINVLDAAMGSNTTPTSSAANRHSTAEDPRVEECCICLFAIAPLQALFVAPCSHTFHFKCCRPLLQHYPGFQCPLCRSYSDLDASVAIETDEVCFSFQVIDIILIFFLRCYKCSKPKKNPSKKKVSMLGYLYWTRY